MWQDQLRIIAEADFNGNVQKRFFYGIGINVPDYMNFQGRKYLFVKDHRGSVNLVVDSITGEIKQKMLYSEWGEVIEDTNPGFQPFGFAGGLYDQDTKLYRFGARDYDPEVGRLLAKDPIGFAGGDVNLYGYVLQDPVNLIDATGKLRYPGDIMDEALENPNSSSGTSDRANGFQHCFASCMMTAENGGSLAAILDTGFEMVNSFKGQSEADYNMDMANNKTRRELGKNCPVKNKLVDEKKSKGISSYCQNACMGALYCSG